MVVGVNATPRPLYPWERDPVTTVQDDGRAPGAAWTDAQNLAPLAFDSRTVQLFANRYTDYTIPTNTNTVCGQTVTASGT